MARNLGGRLAILASMHCWLVLVMLTGLLRTLQVNNSMRNLVNIFKFINLADFLGGKHCLRKDHREDLCTVGETGRREGESIIYPRWETVGDLSRVTD